MKTHRPSIAGSEEASVLKQLDAAIALLGLAARYAQSKGFSGLAGLKRSLARMRRLRKKIRSHPGKPIDWQRVIMAIVFIAEVVHELCTILFCHIPRESRSENWVRYKAA